MISKVQCDPPQKKQDPYYFYKNIWVLFFFLVGGHRVLYFFKIEAIKSLNGRGWGKVYIYCDIY